MDFSKNGLKVLTFVFVLVLIITVTFSACLTVVYGAGIPTTAYIGVSPNPIEVDQELLVSVWLRPSIPSTQIYHELTVEFRKPDGSIDVVGPFNSEVWGTGSYQFNYVPDRVGTWQVRVSYAGGDSIDGNIYLASTSPVQEFTVQKDPIPPWIYTELPTGYTYWGRPINAENREWASYAGDWPQPGYNASMTYFNPYSTAPNTPHILWARQTGVTGLIGGKYNGTSYFGGSNVDIILAGLAYYTASDGVHCIDVHTGEELWVKPGISPSIGVAAPQHFYAAGPSLVAELWQVGENYTKYDPYTGVETLTVPDALPGVYAEPYFYSYINGRLITWETDKRVVDSNASLGVINSFNDLIVSNVSCDYDFNIIWDNTQIYTDAYAQNSYDGSVV